ncbi:hypothetical protein GCU60_19320 [Blastococcus saxobsidens]|uniref:Uncharacterized protein n=1 Tax=Blastococcus saxobsidens TaxID=138336 RepID=A0A6L9W743_9ACTN|nr:hypothetical protein [Blastococcus saxobsidens]NEK87895.1 hypothetical protein [Blastococcus saxobsidens]
MNLLRTSTSALAGFALVTMGLMVPTAVNAAPAPPPDPLTVQESGGSTAVTYGHSRTFIAASSVTEAADKHKARIEVNGKTFTAKLDKRTSTVKWGGGGRTLDPADAGALQAMAEDLHSKFLVDAAGQRALNGDTELLIRFTMLLAEAPAGVKLKDYVVEAPVMEQVSPEEEAAVGVPAADDSECAAGAEGAPGGEMSIAACQVADDDGIRYMSCSRLSRVLYHDAAGHCFESEVVTSGPGSSGSLGECGSGVTGIGTYTYDCGEHDRCGRVHGGSFNPWDSECGDEYFDADDDFLLAPIGRC